MENLAMSRPTTLVVVSGTGTEVGKTWFGCRLAEHLRRAGSTVGARKPAQSFTPEDGPTDADLLAAATGEAPAMVCSPHRWYELAMAPFMAAEVLGRPPFSMADLVHEVSGSWPVQLDVGLVEGAGGVRSPMSSDGGDTIDLVAALRPEAVVLVADAGLGTINAVRLAAAALDGARYFVFLNRFDSDDELHRRNAAWLQANLGAPVVTSLLEAFACL